MQRPLVLISDVVGVTTWYGWIRLLIEALAELDHFFMRGVKDYWISEH